MATFTDQLTSEFKSVETGVWASVYAALHQTFADMVKRCPVKTGFLMNHIYVQSEPRNKIVSKRERNSNATYPPPPRPKFHRAKQYTFGCNVEYADFIEYFGHSSIAPNGFMRISLVEFKVHLKELLNMRKIRKKQPINMEAFGEFD